MFREIPDHYANELRQAGFVTRLAGVCQGMDDFSDVADKVERVLELVVMMTPQERREIVAKIDASRLVQEMVNAKVWADDGFDEETVISRARYLGQLRERARLILLDKGMINNGGSSAVSKWMVALEIFFFNQRSYRRIPRCAAWSDEDRHLSRD
jgi:hypothetical protein